MPACMHACTHVNLQKLVHDVRYAVLRHSFFFVCAATASATQSNKVFIVVHAYNIKMSECV